MAGGSATRADSDAGQRSGKLGPDAPVLSRSLGHIIRLPARRSRKTAVFRVEGGSSTSGTMLHARCSPAVRCPGQNQPASRGQSDMRCSFTVSGPPSSKAGPKVPHLHDWLPLAVPLLPPHRPEPPREAAPLTEVRTRSSWLVFIQRERCAHVVHANCDGKRCGIWLTQPCDFMR